MANNFVGLGIGLFAPELQLPRWTVLTAAALIALGLWLCKSKIQSDGQVPASARALTPQ
ncbi:MAG: hypothetical protein ACT4TC_03480 [Myxococcaceae bacterium]